jgi:predicted O-methyltransferase YrrM
LKLTASKEPIRHPAKLGWIMERTRELGFHMASEELTGVLLRTLAASKPGGRFLELGTGTGVSTAWILDGMDAGAELTSIDTDANVQEVARQALSADRRLTLICGDALFFLAHQPAASYDFVFADAMPGKYENLAEALAVVKPGGFYVIDDMLPQVHWPKDHASRVEQLLADMARHPGFETTNLTWASGIVVAVRKH